LVALVGLVASPGFTGLEARADQAPPSSSSSSRSPQDNRPVGVRWEWWKDPEVKKAIQLSDAKTQKIDNVYTRFEVDIKPVVDKIVVEQDKLNQMTKERVADEAAYALQVSQVESLWARWRESRTVMLYRMYLQLQPDQYKKLLEILDRRFSGDGRGRGPGPGR
jgi:Spy/CpxP family protein refolding chaperone